MTSSDAESENMLALPNLDWFLPFFRGFLLGLAALMLHEMAHIVAALALGIRVKRVGLEWKGLYTVREAGPLHKNLLVALAGPLMNMALIVAGHWLPAFGVANLCFAIANLLPIKGSDGERIVDCCQKLYRRSLMA